MQEEHCSLHSLSPARNVHVIHLSPSLPLPPSPSHSLPPSLATSVPLFFFFSLFSLSPFLSAFFPSICRKQGEELLGGGRRGKGGILLFRVGHRRRDGVIDLRSSRSDTEAESNATIGTGRGGCEEGGDILAWVKERIEAAGGLAGNERVPRVKTGLQPPIRLAKPLYGRLQSSLANHPSS